MSDWKMVPVSPDQNMLKHGDMAMEMCGDTTLVYESMIEVAPSPWQDIATAPEGQALFFHPKTKERSPMPATMRVGRVSDWPYRPPTHWMPLPEPPQ